MRLPCKPKPRLHHTRCGSESRGPPPRVSPHRPFNLASSEMPLALGEARVSLMFMNLAQNIPRLSEAEYLRLERQAETRSEYFDGEMFAMAGGTRAHSLIATNLLSELSNRLR